MFGERLARLREPGGRVEYSRAGRTCRPARNSHGLRSGRRRIERGAASAVYFGGFFGEEIQKTSGIESNCEYTDFPVSH